MNFWYIASCLSHEFPMRLKNLDWDMSLRYWSKVRGGTSLVISQIYPQKADENEVKRKVNRGEKVKKLLENDVGCSCGPGSYSG